MSLAESGKHAVQDDTPLRLPLTVSRWSGIFDRMVLTVSIFIREYGAGKADA